MKCVYCAVGTGYLYIIQISLVNGSNFLNLMGNK